MIIAQTLNTILVSEDSGTITTIKPGHPKWNRLFDILSSFNECFLIDKTNDQEPPTSSCSNGKLTPTQNPTPDSLPAVSSISMSIYSRIINLMSEQLAIPVNEIQPDSTLMSLGADSLDGVELLMAMEEEFGIEISDDSIEKYSTATVGQIACDLEFHLTLNSDPAVAGILPDDQAAYHMGVVDGSREYVIDAGMNIFNPKYLIADVNGADSSAHDAYIRGYVFGYTS